MSDSKNELAEERTDLAQDRTDWAEDRTVLANERTFAGWIRTGLAGIGLGLGFNALFKDIDPTWVPKLIASIFILGGIVTIFVSQREAVKCLERLDDHAVQPAARSRMRWLAAIFITGGAFLLLALWWLR